VKYTKAECTAADKYVIDGKEYNECDSSAGSSCPSTGDLFKEPDFPVSLSNADIV